MPSKLILSVLCVSGFVLGIGGSYGWEKVSEHVSKKQDRKVASEVPMGKHQSAIFVRILEPDSIPDNDYTEIELKGYIVKRADNLGDIQYTWNLPEGVVTGDTLDGVIENVPTGTSIEVILRVRGFSKAEAKAVTLEAHSFRGPQQLGSSALISSRPEDAMEYIAPIMADVAPNGPDIHKVQR